MRFITKKRKIDFSLYGVSQLINLLAPVLLLPHIVNVCGESGLGKAGVGFSIALILNSVIDYGSYVLGVREISINRDNRDKLNKLFFAIYSAKTYLLIGVTVFYLVLISTIPYFNQEFALYLLSFAIVIGQFLNPAWFLQGVENFKWLSFMTIFSKLFYIFGVLFFVSSIDDYVYVNLSFGLGMILSSLFVIGLIIKKYKFQRGRFDFIRGRKIIKEEFSFSLSQFFLSVHQYIPIFIVSVVLGDAASGIYKIIDQVLSVFKTYLNMVFYFLYSNICNEINLNIKNGIKTWFKYNLLSQSFLFILMVTCFVFAEKIMMYITKNVEDIEGHVVLFQWSLLIVFILSFSAPLKQLVFAFQKSKAYVRITIIATFANIFLLFFLTNAYDLFGAIVASIIIETLVLITFAIILKEKLSPNPFFNEV
ncbi:MAG: oligosaccharide flippase family protein [Flavobacterium sp.]